jgi:hypothetical protein
VELLVERRLERQVQERELKRLVLEQQELGLTIEVSKDADMSV